jgi:1,4-alpha-glucan branching enzyme
MSLKKQYSKTKPVCKVIFKLDKEVSASIKKANLAGDFNKWDMNSIPMKESKTGEYTVSLELEKGREYQFRYLLDHEKWINEDHADKHVPNAFQGQNSVVIV